jgi:hypothetical protein
MSFEWWSWTSYVLGVLTALMPSAFAFFYFVHRAPLMDDSGRIIADGIVDSRDEGIALGPRPINLKGKRETPQAS